MEKNHSYAYCYGYDQRAFQTSSVTGSLALAGPAGPGGSRGQRDLGLREQPAAAVAQGECWLDADGMGWRSNESRCLEFFVFLEFMNIPQFKKVSQKP